MTSHDFDIVIVGGGVAAACAASTLAGAGARILQLVHPERANAHPIEVLSPTARRSLVRCGLGEPNTGSSECDGVLSSWERGAPLFGDYALMTGIAGLAVDKRAMHRMLGERSQAAGVRVEICRRSSVSASTDGRHGVVFWVSMRGEIFEAQAAQVLIASGRSARTLLNETIHVRFDRAIALWTEFLPQAHSSKLLIEATSSGWWYATPSVDAASQLVFVTDADQVPRGAEARSAWLQTQYDESRLISSCASARPSFAVTLGTDAHFGVHLPFAWTWGARIGAAALSLDPLSSTGIARAIEGACMAAEEIIREGAAGEQYSQLMRDMIADEMQLRVRTYGRVKNRFPDSSFWARHASVSLGMSPILQEPDRHLSWR